MLKTIMNMDYYQLFFAIGAVVLAIYYYYTSIYNYWKNRGIPGPIPGPFLGNFWNVITRKYATATLVKNWYNEFKHEPVFGIYEGTKPLLVINDLELVKDVLIRDFSFFMDRGFQVFEKIEPLAQHLFLLESERWRPLRSKLSPIFTSGKLKEMFPLVLECAGNLEKFLDKVADSGEPVDCREMSAKFTTDVIGSCAFGISMNALEDEDSEFRRMGRQIFTDFKVLARIVCRQLAPSLIKVFGRWLQSTEIDNFFIGIVHDTMEYREKNNVRRPDMINMLMELKNHPDKVNSIELTDTLLAAQAFVFFIAGFETSSSTMGHALYELAQNQDVQDKLRQEIRDTYKKNGGTLTYADIKEMKYLDKVFKETLRKYPILTMLTRRAMENYTFKGTKITIPKGMKIWVPVYGIQTDPDIYPEPEKFDPERFEDDAVAARHPMSFLPFGDGPRNCIGARFAHIQSKIGLSTILRNHKVDVCEKTTIPYEPDERAFLLTLKGGVNLKITKVQS
ncbi:probable cytochrome P450 6a14 isoform X2 [Frieseomelitta varia]|uniref:probable cytochrome P450 6a14 isoform X2 n=3 Tax=Frieseomelitta varia TaxID=561572 RepID=UPI001CB6A057|nr:probable cytochrome P450 6a14 isoform X2 [Frieseomelitta varia]